MASPRKSKGVKAPAILQLPHNNWRPRWYQEPIWNYLDADGKRGVAVCHRRYGKDELALHRAAVAAHKKVAAYWHLLPEIAQARRAIWNAVNPHTGKRRIDEAFPEHLRRRTAENEMLIEFRNGSTWQVLGSDNFDSLVGSSPYGIVFSEWALANPAAWAYMRPILAENDGWAFWIYTARGRNHGLTTWEMSQAEEGWFGVRQTALDTDVFTQAQLDSEFRQYVADYGETDGQSLFAQEYLCSFDAAVIGAYYGAEILRMETDRPSRITRVPYDRNYPVYTSWDLGLDDASVVWFVQLVGREVRWIDHYRTRNRALVDVARDVLAKGYVFAEHYLPHDVEAREITSAKTRKDTLEQLGLKPIRPGNNKIGPAERIHALRNLLSRSVFDAVNCKAGLEALRHYHAEWDQKAHTPRKTPKHDWSSHDADAAGEMAVQLMDRSGIVRMPAIQGTYDPFRIGQPAYTRQLNTEALAAEDNWEQPWRHQHTAGVDGYDPFKH